MTSKRTAATAHETDAGFLASYDASRFDCMSVAVDAVILTVTGDELRCLLVRRDEPPQRGSWALPGGFVGFSESLDAAVERVLVAKCGLSGAYTEQLYTFGSPQRDPRTRVLSVAYLALVDPGRMAARRDGACLARIDVPWRGERGGPVTARADSGELPLAFDHNEIIGLAVKRLRGKLDYAPVGYELLPRYFTLRQLQRIHQAILGRAMNKDSFRRRILAGGQLKATGEREAGVAYRPAELYRFTTGTTPASTARTGITPTGTGRTGITPTDTGHTGTTPASTARTGTTSTGTGRTGAAPTDTTRAGRKEKRNG